MKKRYNVLLLAMVIIWTSVIFSSAILLRATPEFPTLLSILIGGAAGTLIVFSGVSGQENKNSS